MIRALVKSSKANSSSSGVRFFEIPSALVQAAADAKAQRFHEAELALRQALASDPQNGALHFAL